MPFVSQAQRGYFNANKKKLEGQGVNVDEWNSASKGLDLPEKVESGAGDPNETPKKPKKFNYAPKKTRAGYTQAQRAA